MTLNKAQKHDLLHVAAHEAGHVAYALYSGMPKATVRIWLNPNPKLRPCELTILGRTENCTLEEAIDRVALGFSGIIAEALFFNNNYDEDELYALACQPSSLSDSDKRDMPALDPATKRKAFDEAFQVVRDRLTMIPVHVHDMAKAFAETVSTGGTFTKTDVFSLLVPGTPVP